MKKKQTVKSIAFYNNNIFFEVSTSMMSRIIKTGYKALDLVYFFTAGPDEVRAWTVRADSKAP